MDEGAREAGDEIAAKRGIADAFSAVLELAIPQTDRERQAQGLEKTPARAAEAFQFFTKGYRDNLQCMLQHRDRTVC